MTECPEHRPRTPAQPGINRSITLPAYVRDVAKVQLWCAFVEVVLGEASFARPVALNASR